jgi:Rrf2 family transcriptional repressor of oqxAB
MAAAPRSGRRRPAHASLPRCSEAEAEAEAGSRSWLSAVPTPAPRTEGPRECLVTNHSAEYFARLTDETEAAVLGALAGRTLADGLDELRAIDRVDGAPASGAPD